MKSRFVGVLVGLLILAYMVIPSTPLAPMFGFATPPTILTNCSAGHPTPTGCTFEMNTPAPPYLR